jgi:hypothetical protein
MKSFKKARKTMRKHLNKDEGLRLGYRANIAMLLYDDQIIQIGNSDNSKSLDLKRLEYCNSIADKLIDLIFWK